MKLQLPLSILVYHRVPAQTDPLFPEQVDARRFERQLRLRQGIHDSEKARPAR